MTDAPARAKSLGAASAATTLRVLTALVGLAVVAACGQVVAGSGSGGGTPVAPPVTIRPLGAQPVSVDGGLECPASIDDAEGMTVPEPPQGTDATARLLPDREPSSLVVCSYPVLDIRSGPLEPPFPLTKRSAITGSERDEVVQLLTWAPRGDGRDKVCTEMGGDETVHLVGARYDDAVVWVAAKSDPNSCSDSTNGDFVSSAAVGVALDALVGGEPAPRPQAECLPPGQGRLGDDVSLVPEGDPVVTVCRVAASGAPAPTLLDAEQGRQVVAALRALPVRPTRHVCEGADQSATDDFRLVLTYPEGPPSVINVTPTCEPPVLGTSLESTEVGQVVRLVERWSPPIQGPGKDGAVSSEPGGS